MKHTIIDKIQDNIRDIKDDEPALIIVNHKTYKKLKEFTPKWMDLNDLSQTTIFGLPIIVENIKEDCIVLSKKSVEMIKNACKK